MPRADVVVVGAGLAGLAAAGRLQHAGRDVVVLEARNRVGGRVHSTRTANGSAVDLGAQWIGPGQDRMYALTRSYGIDVVATHKTGKHIFDLGRGVEVTRREVPPLPFFALLDAMQIALRLDRAARNTSPDEPWTRQAADRYDRETALEWIERASYTRAGRAFWSGLAEGATCADPSRSTALDLMQQTRSIGGLAALGTAEQDYMTDGAQTLANCMAKELVRKVELGTPVRLVEHRTDGVRVVSSGDAWDARRVIVAVPLSVLDTVVFEPALPEPRRDLARCLVRVDVIKSVVVYERPFWRDEGFSGIAFSLPGPANTVLDASPPAGGTGILVALAAGRLAVALGALPLEQRRETVIRHLARCFPVLDDKSPVEYLECNWSDEEWSGGGYASRLGAGAWGTLGRALRTPVGPVHWAGTEIATEWRSYMEGAVRSGERAAEEILATT